MDDLSAFTDDLRAELPVLLPLTILFAALASLTVLNMLIGVLCEVVSEVAETERDEIRTDTLSEKMREVVDELDNDNNQLLSYKEFAEIMKKPVALKALEDV